MSLRRAMALSCLGWFSIVGCTRQLPETTEKKPTSIRSINEVQTMSTVSVRYIVDDVDVAIEFYATHLGFEVELHPSPSFAALSRNNLRLLLSKPSGGGGAGQIMPDGRVPEPGGWNRIQIQVTNLAEDVENLRKAGAHFRNEIVVGNGGKQILLNDPSGNAIELFQSSR
jgi:catechol 2,3-dioxygenase-like lactoylglutathione lyase family enzyme